MVVEAISSGARGARSPLQTLPLPASLLVLLPLLASSAAVPVSAPEEVPAEVTKDPVGAIRHLLPEVNLERARSITVVKGHRGGTLFLPCRFHEVTQDQEVSWIRLRDWHILTTGVYTYTNDKRFSVLHADGTIDWTLQLRKAQPSDNGTYECQMSTGSGVVSRFVEVMVSVPEARIIGGSIAQVQEGEALTLHCVIKPSPTPNGIVFWYHEDVMLNFGSNRHNITTRDEGMHAYSRLAVTSARPTDAGNYTCSSRNSRAATVNVSVTQDTPTRSPATTAETSTASAVTVHILCIAVVLAVHKVTR